MADAVRRAHRNPDAYRGISEHRRRTLTARLSRRVQRNSRLYRKWMLRTHGFVDGDWVRVLGKYEFQVNDAGEWTYSKWLPTADGGWVAEVAAPPKG